MLDKNIDSNTERIIEFLKLNGAILESVQTDDGIIYEFDYFGYGIDVCLSDNGYDEIAFIGESGDFAHISLDYYALVGYMIEARMICMNYKSAPIKSPKQIDQINIVIK